MKKIIILLFLLISQGAYAAFVASKSGYLNRNVPSRLIVVSHAGELGNLFAHSAITKAKAYHEYDKSSQVIIIATDDYRGFFQNQGYKIIDKTRSLLNHKDVAKVIAATRSVLSLDVYSHANAIRGMILDKNLMSIEYLEEGDAAWDELKKKKTAKTFVFMHGCSTGVKLAPWVAQKVGVVTLGSLTGTNFQYVYQNDVWAHGYQMDQMLKVTRSELGVEKTRDCLKGECVRMKPDNAVYRGVWGEWTAGGFPSYKVFCAHTENSKVCQLGAVEAIKTFPSITAAKSVDSLEKFKSVAKEFLCPFGHDESKQQQCFDELENSLYDDQSTYTPFQGKTLNCNLKSCQVSFDCNAFQARYASRTCKLVNHSPGVNQSFVKEFKFLVKSFQKNN